MKRVIAVLSSITVMGCAAIPASNFTGPVSEEPESFDGMTIDLDRMQAVTPNWTVALSDCSDETVECVEAPGHFLLSMQKHCSRDIEWEAGGFRYTVIAPSAHFGLPSGSYMSLKYPHVHWWFGAPLKRGVHRWARTGGTPSDRTWNTNEVLEEYQVRMVGTDDRFRCA